ncbi:MAG TPA: hypothetical protein VHD60_03355 [Candidatus Saccharimonadales bacterium]|nr:hypothetical protein [Candidatus Saccharimonadales bacterium]
MAAEIFAILSGLILVAGAPPYLIDILKHKTKPERATWFIWSVLGTIAFISQLSLHGGWSLLFVGLDGLGSIIVFLLSLKYGVGGWTWLDRIALIIAAAGVVISLVAHSPTLALCGVVLADISGVVLTIRKTFLDPGSETTITWFFVGTSALLGALSVGKVQFDLLLYPVYLTIGNYGVLTAKYLGLALGRRTAAD